VKPRHQALVELLADIERNPFSLPEWNALWRELITREAAVAEAGMRVAKERADVEWVGHPVVKLALWLQGSLAERTAKEQREYDAALATLMEMGGLAQRHRAWLEKLDQHSILPSDEQVYDVLRAVSADAFAHFARPELGFVHERAIQARRCETLAERSRIHKPSMWTHLERELLELDERTLARRASHAPTGEAARALLDGIHLTLTDRYQRGVNGLSDALREAVKRALFTAQTT
jgi:hypothetical protein